MLGGPNLQAGLVYDGRTRCRCYPYAGLYASSFTVLRLRPSISVHTSGRRKPLSENVAPLLTNDQKIMAYQCVITGDKRRNCKTRRKLPAMNIVQPREKRPYDTPPTYDRLQCPTLQHRNIRRSSATAQSRDAAKPATIGKTRRRIAAHSICSRHRIRGSLQLEVGINAITAPPNRHPQYGTQCAPIQGHLHRIINLRAKTRNSSHRHKRLRENTTRLLKRRATQLISML